MTVDVVKVLFRIGLEADQQLGCEIGACAINHLPRVALLLETVSAPEKCRRLAIPRVNASSPQECVRRGLPRSFEIRLMLRDLLHALSSCSVDDGHDATTSPPTMDASQIDHLVAYAALRSLSNSLLFKVV